MAGKEMIKEFLKNLNKEIEAKEYSDEEVLEKTGMDKKNLYPYLQGKKPISIDKITEMCIRLDIDPRNVFRLSDEALDRVFSGILLEEVL